MPAVGTVLTHKNRDGSEVSVTVVEGEEPFLFEGTKYASISAAAKAASVATEVAITQVQSQDAAASGQNGQPPLEDVVRQMMQSQRGKPM